MPVKSEVVELVNPTNGQMFKALKIDSKEDLKRKLDRAQKAQKKWSAVPFEERKKVIKKFAKSLQENKKRLAKDLTQEMGKPLWQAEGEIAGTNSRIEFFLKNTAEYIKPRKKSKKEIISWEPLGVIANISAWNYPYFVGSNVFIPALLTGNAVLYKPSEITAKTGKNIETLFKKSGLPSGLFQAVIGEGNIGEELLSLDIDGVYFTGSYRTGARIAERVAPKMIRTQMELGGKDPIYVAEDVDILKAAQALGDGAFYNSGQSCCSVERIYVHRKIVKAFTNAFVEEVKKFVVGDPKKKGVYIGPLARKEQIPFLEDQVRDALAKGAKIELGGKRLSGPGYFFEPTVLTNVNHEMRVMRDESFGPIIGVQGVQNEKEAIELMNDTEYGLTAGVYTKSKVRANSILAQLNAGSVYWNCCDRVNPCLPWSGRNKSGVGSTLSELGIEAFVQPKALHLG